MYASMGSSKVAQEHSNKAVLGGRGVGSQAASHSH